MIAPSCLVVGGVGLKKGRIKNAQKAMVLLAKELNPVLREEGYLVGAPFSLMNVIFRYGSKFDPRPDCEPISQTHNELPFAVEVDMDKLANAPVEVVWRAFAEVLLGALVRIAEQYNLNPRGVHRFAELHSVSIE